MSKSIDTLVFEREETKRVAARAARDYKRYEKHFGISHRLVQVRWVQMMDAERAAANAHHAWFDAWLAAYDARVAARKS